MAKELENEFDLKDDSMNRLLKAAEKDQAEQEKPRSEADQELDEIQKMKEGFYYFIQFDANAEAPAQIEASVRIMESVLRYLCVRQDAE